MLEINEQKEYFHIVTQGDTLWKISKDYRISIKDIIRATTPSDINYDDKDGISSGDAAQLAWFIYTDPKTSEKDKELQRKLLIEYCSKDTLVLYYLVKHLMDSYV
mgnify:CR=1 FL=1